MHARGFRAQPLDIGFADLGLGHSCLQGLAAGPERRYFFGWGGWMFMAALSEVMGRPLTPSGAALAAHTAQ